MKTYKIELTPSETEQLRALWRHGMTRPGDLISKPAEKLLREKGLSDRTEDGQWCAATDKGASWLRSAGLIPQQDS